MEDRVAMNESIARGRYEGGENGGIQGEDARWFQLCWFLCTFCVAGAGILTVVCQVVLGVRGTIDYVDPGEG